MKVFFHLAANTCVALLLFITGIITQPLAVISFILYALLPYLDIVFLFFYLLITEKKKEPKDLISALKKEDFLASGRTYVFHSPEFTLGIMLLTIYYPVLVLLLISLVLHLVLDILEYYHKNKSLFFLRRWSLVWHLAQFMRKP
ncbi:hypothetical protein COY95_02520 [Candidatus Woesearchaeota archaeon CG_4_10_14_0_8_um_filter_47_5]|nr:MAG: hypothetical protein COY95_02520 [Candidatus Woesearchaeota archaeon CG_4_10_14_0_8_um_filter_47_5]